MKSVDEYLQLTDFCDFNHPNIISKAKELTIEDKTPKEMALSIFQFVRDQIKFMMNYEDDKASDTLAKGYGDCGTKTNLQVALLRSINIPARFHFVSLYKKSIKGIVSKLFYLLSPKVIPYHPWCECYLSDKWIACDTLLDKPLVNNIYKNGIFTKEDIKTIDWDGEHDLNTMTNWIVEDKGIYSSLDEIINLEEISTKIPIRLVSFLFNHSNNCTEKLRNERD